ncbi:hypothetical protein WICPIJ_004117 [Wickerhamomyces pijperi]|uniref:Uncharacterized protein n=1 Tax=Wickerhamomyces pijperi TaxID=599730 RepID=A0A9P8TN83_WICPI|nr:hypothetical protein WICPIJ_004117 [Wickerhamomyces pijperi]
MVALQSHAEFLDAEESWISNIVSTDSMSFRLSIFFCLSFFAELSFFSLVDAGLAISSEVVVLVAFLSLGRLLLNFGFSGICWFQALAVCLTGSGFLVKEGTAGVRGEGLGLAAFAKEGFVLALGFEEDGLLVEVILAMKSRASGDWPKRSNQYLEIADCVSNCKEFCTICCKVSSSSGRSWPSSLTAVFLSMSDTLELLLKNCCCSIMSQRTKC